MYVLSGTSGMSEAGSTISLTPSSHQIHVSENKKCHTLQSKNIYKTIFDLKSAERAKNIQFRQERQHSYKKQFSCRRGNIPFHIS